jgi:hypothetical protein
MKTIFAKLISGEFVIGIKNDEKQAIDSPYVVVPISQKEFALMKYCGFFTKENKSVPYEYIMIEYTPLEEIETKYLEMKSGLTLPKKKIKKGNLINLASQRNVN